MISGMAPHPFDASFELVRRPWGRAFRCHALPFDHLFTTRDIDAGGDVGANAHSWAAVGESLGLGVDRLARGRQVHGAGVITVRAGAQLSDDVPEADILVSNDVSRAVTVRVADCVPILLGDPVQGVVAAAHAGWRGTALRVAATAVDRLRADFGSRPQNLVAAIGPCIGPDAYEVGEAVREQFVASGFDRAELERWFLSRDGVRPHLDMWRANTDQLASAGVPAGRIHCLGACTRANPEWFFSYRGEGERSGRMVSAIRAGSL